MALAKTTAKTTKAKASEVQDLPRISVGTVFDTSNESFFAGRPQPSDGKYDNQEELLGMLPTPPDGYHWSLKLFVRETRSGRTLCDIILQVEEDYQKPAE